MVHLKWVRCFVFASLGTASIGQGLPDLERLYCVRAINSGLLVEAYLQSAVFICSRTSGIVVVRALEPLVLFLYLLAITEHAEEIASILLMPRWLH